MRKGLFELSVVSRGSSCDEFIHQNNIYIESKIGSKFSLHFKNLSNEDVIVIISINGKSILGGDIATVNSPGFIISKNSEKKFTSALYNKYFYFNKEKSNIGVIGLLVLKKPTKNTIFGYNDWKWMESNYPPIIDHTPHVSPDIGRMPEIICDHITDSTDSISNIGNITYRILDEFQIESIFEIYHMSREKLEKMGIDISNVIRMPQAFQF